MNDIEKSNGASGPLSSVLPDSLRADDHERMQLHLARMQLAQERLRSANIEMQALQVEKKNLELREADLHQRGPQLLKSLEEEQGKAQELVASFRNDYQLGPGDDISNDGKIVRVASRPAQ